jgi:hypothetical protein
VTVVNAGLDAIGVNEVVDAARRWLV